MIRTKPDAGPHVLRTSTILADPALLRPLREMISDDPWISRASRFVDARWVLDLEPPFQQPIVVLDWDGVGERLRMELKLVLLVQGSRGGRNGRLRVDTLFGFGKGAVMLGRWMNCERFARLADLGPGGGDEFLKALAEKATEIASLDPEEELDGWDPRMGRQRAFGHDGALSQGVVKAVAGFLLSARLASDELAALGVEPIAHPPFSPDAAGTRAARTIGRRNASRTDGGVTAKGLAERYGRLVGHVRERVPDPVRNRMLESFERLLGLPAEDNLRLVRRFCALCAEGLAPMEALRRLDGFGFSVIAGERQAWRPPLCATGGMRNLDRVLRDVVGPAAAIVMDATGVRPGEFVMLADGRRARPDISTTRAADARLLEVYSGRPAEPPLATGRVASWPACLSETLSISGLSVLIFLNGRIFKQRRRPTAAYWLLGSRQDDGPDPIAVRALDLLERLAATLRPFADEDGEGRLLLDLVDCPGGPLRCTGKKLSSLGADVSRSIARHVDLAGMPPMDGVRDISRWVAFDGRNFSLYQFRRTYVQLAYRTEPRLLVPLARQLHHTDTVVTKRSYVTNDPTLLRELELEHSRASRAMFRELVEGRRRLCGPMGDRMTAFAESVAGRVAALPEVEREAAVARLFRVGEYRMHFLDGVTCMIGLRPDAALCNRGTGRAGFKVDEPDLTVRDDTMCAGCANGCFDRDRHGPVILRRYLMNRTTWLRQRRAGRGGLYGAWRRRAERDAAFLDRLGIPYPSDEEISRGL